MCLRESEHQHSLIVERFLRRSDDKYKYVLVYIIVYA